MPGRSRRDPHAGGTVRRRRVGPVVGDLVEHREGPDRVWQAVVDHDVADPARLSEDRRVARTPRCGGRACGVGGDHHARGSGPGVGGYGSAEGVEAAHSAALPAVGFVALRVRQPAVLVGSPELAALRVPVGPRSRRLRIDDSGRCPSRGVDHRRRPLPPRHPRPRRRARRPRSTRRGEHRVGRDDRGRSRAARRARWPLRGEADPSPGVARSTGTDRSPHRRRRTPPRSGNPLGRADRSGRQRRLATRRLGDPRSRPPPRHRHRGPRPCRDRPPTRPPHLRPHPGAAGLAALPPPQVHRRGPRPSRSLGRRSPSPTPPAPHTTPPPSRPHRNCTRRDRRHRGWWTDAIPCLS